MKPDYEHIEKTLQELALEKLCIETLEMRHSDSLDYHTVQVGCLHDALEAAFHDGMSYAKRLMKGTKS